MASADGPKVGLAVLPFWRLVLGAGIVSGPAFALDATGNRRAAWAYVALVLLMLVVTNWETLSEPVSYFQKQLTG